MTANDIQQAKDPDLRSSVAAMNRAAAIARKTAIQTNTALVIIKNGELLRIPAETLRQETCDPKKLF